MPVIHQEEMQIETLDRLAPQWETLEAITEGRIYEVWLSIYAYAKIQPSSKFASFNDCERYPLKLTKIVL